MLTADGRTRAMTDSSDQQWRVVINHEGQYSILRDYDPPVNGWHDVGFSGTKDECVAHIDQVWTDMRPLSVRSL